MLPRLFWGSDRNNCGDIYNFYFNGVCEIENYTYKNTSQI